MRIGLKPGVYERRVTRLMTAMEIKLDDVAAWVDWAYRVKPTLHLNGQGWTIKAGSMSLALEDGEVVGDAWLYFWLTGDVSRMKLQDWEDLTDLAREMDAQPLEVL